MQSRQAGEGAEFLQHLQLKKTRCFAARQTGIYHLFFYTQYIGCFLFPYRYMAIIEDIYDTFGNILDLDFDLDVSKSMANNRRVYTRYIRNDIEVVFYKIDIFTGLGVTYFRRLIPAELLDISSKGVLITSDKKLKPDTKIVLGLKFDSGKTFWINALIVCTSTTTKNPETDAGIVYKYGIKFYRYNNELGDYLLETQSELNFK